MTIQIAGNPPYSNLSYLEVMEKLRDMIISNWTLGPPNGPAIGDVRFNFDWWDNYGEFLVTMVNIVTDSTPENIGWTYRKNDMFVEIHLWVRQLTQEHPRFAGNFAKHIEEILDDNKDGLTSYGISYIWPSQFREVGNQDPTSTLWHAVNTVRITFRRVET